MKGKGQRRPKAKRIDEGVRAGVKWREAQRTALDLPETELARLRWYAITTPPGYERMVEFWLEGLGIVALVPMHQVYRAPNMHVKSKRAVRFPLLPRYLFIGFGGPVNNWGTVFGLNLWLGRDVVTGAIGQDERPWRMDGKKIAAWLVANGMVRADAAERFMRTGREFAVDDMVEIADGPFVGHTGKVVSMADGEARVLMTLFATEREVPLPLAILEKSA